MVDFFVKEVLVLSVIFTSFAEERGFVGVLLLIFVDFFASLFSMSETDDREE